jgi:hypothetical protein
VRFSQRLAEVAIRGKDAVAVVNAESALLLMALNDAAEADGPRLGRDLTRQLEKALGGELRTASSAEAEVRERELSGQATAMRHALALLDEAVRASGQPAP